MSHLSNRTVKLALTSELCPKERELKSLLSRHTRVSLYVLDGKHSAKHVV